jgi:hypothetical protein
MKRSDLRMWYTEEMKRSAVLLLQVVIVVLGIVTVAALLWEPWVEGVNANVTSLYGIYFDDPFLAYIYVSFIAVFVGLYSACKLAGHVGHGKVCLPRSVHALRTITYCALLFASYSRRLRFLRSQIAAQKTSRGVLPSVFSSSLHSS